MYMGILPVSNRSSRIKQVILVFREMKKQTSS